MIGRRQALHGLVSLGAASAVGRAWGQAADYPSKQIRLCVPGAAGGGTDALARLMANSLAESKKWSFVVENLPGAGGTLGLAAVAKAANDGYTIGIGETGNLVNAPFLYDKLRFNVETDLEPVVLIAKVPLVLVVPASGKVDSVASLVAAAKQKALTFASAGNGSVGHLTGELWKRKLSLQLTHVPYRGAAPAMTDLAGGHVDLSFTSIASALPMIRSGKVRPLAVTSVTRVPLLKDVPSFGELGHRDTEAAVIYGVVAPKGTPAEVVKRLNTEINRALGTPAVRQALTDIGADTEIHGGEPKLFSSFLWQERAKWGKLIKEAGVKAD